jgi:glycine/D-amino acid oxidase-like deaminating enzyme
MARHESEREDLLREATALVERIELSLYGQSVFAGFRRDGCASFYFDGDPAYHFNTQRQLRRAFVAGRLLKAEQRRLVSLERRRDAEEVALIRHEMTPVEIRALVQTAMQQLAQLGAAIQQQGAQIVGQVPPDGNVMQRVQQWLAGLTTIEIAESPHVK